MKSDVHRKGNVARFAALFIVGTVFNYPWELAQSRFYAGAGDGGTLWWHCFVASLGDGLLIWLIFAVGWAVAGRIDWFERPGGSRYVLMMTAGGLIAIGVEWIAVHIAQRWTYTAEMPLFPGLNVGVVPVVQMLVLPPIIFWAVSSWTRPRNLR